MARKAALVLLLAAMCLQAQAWSVFGSSSSDEKQEDAGLEKGDPDSDVVVGGKIETCRGCKLNYLPRLRNFIDNYMGLYEALSIRFIPGAPPELFLVNKYGQTLHRIDLEVHDEKSIPKLLQEHGIDKKTKRYEYTERKFDQTPHCFAFRGREECGLKEERSLRRDKNCRTELENSDAGFCDCIGNVSLPVECGGRDLKITCEALCEDVLTGPEADLD